jgi:hypothetical protein
MIVPPIRPPGWGVPDWLKILAAGNSPRLHRQAARQLLCLCAGGSFVFSLTGPYASRLVIGLITALGLTLACSFMPGRRSAALELEAGSCVGTVRLHGLGFVRDGVEVPPDDAIVLDAVAQMIRESCTGRTVVIEGHTDVSGSLEVNQRLSERRAEVVKRLLVERGVPAEQLRTEGLGESRPVTTDPSPEAQARNRRITLRVGPPR